MQINQIDKIERGEGRYWQFALKIRCLTIFNIGDERINGINW